MKRIEKKSLHANLFRAFLLLATALVLTESYQSRHNTLDLNGRWKSTKLDLAKGVIGGVTFYTTRLTLAENKLNLSAWGSFNEVTYRKLLPLREATFDIWLKRGAYVVFEYNRTDAGFSGFRLSTHRNIPSILFKATSDGGFLATTPISDAHLREGRNQVRVVFERNSTVLYVNNIKVATDSMGSMPLQTISVRGGTGPGPIYIENAVFKLESGIILHENFRNDVHYWRTFAGALALLLLFEAGVSHLVKSSSRLYAQIAALLILFISVSTLCAIDFYWLSKRYPLNMREIEDLSRQLHKSRFKNTIVETREEVLERILHLYPKNAPEKYRIIIIGSSQTWGAGAQNEGEDISSVLEKKLNASRDLPRAGTFECINPSYSGAIASGLWKVYWKYIAALHPKVVIINLSTNDLVVPAFKKTLEKWIRFNVKRNIRTLFVVEAMFSESDPVPLSKSQETMLAVAKQYGVPVINMQEYMDQRRNAGLQWWDQAHLTSFGQKIVAERIFEGLRPLIRLQ